jgi:hypothetical protein
VRFQIDIELDDRLFKDIFLLEYSTERKQRYEDTPGKTIEIDGVKFKSLATRKVFERTKSVAKYRKISFNSLNLEIDGTLTLEYQEYRGCGEYDSHWFGANTINEKIGTVIFFDEEEVSKKAVIFNYSQNFSEEKQV